MSNKKNILFVSSVLTGGGAERVVSVWANGLTKLGIKVAILLMGRTDNEYTVNENVEIISVCPTYNEYSTLGKMEKLILVRRQLKNIRPEYVMPFLPHTQIEIMIASIGLQIKRIETVRYSPWATARKINLIGRVLWHRCFSTAYKIIVQCDEQKEYFHQKMRNKCITIPNPLSEVFINNKKTTYSDKVRNFIAVGRITPQKNYLMMIEAFKDVVNKYPDCILNIFGDPENNYDKTILKKIDNCKLGNNVKLFGRTTNILHHYIKSDAFIMTSNYEGMPNALIEAMSVGLVCISTECQTGPREIIDDRINGFLTPVEDIDSFRNVLEEVCNMNQEMIRMIGTNAHVKISQLCSEKNSIIRLSKVL
jgi:GalNAc-alpha-(1->4)-GalNAc-alpha-(1->3)-diNAcBac-PP-undecaprenol alpha-1,4-N-acetyl-D-galactosaminyltransferase